MREKDNSARHWAKSGKPCGVVWSLRITRRRFDVVTKNSVAMIFAGR
jgi:hypothetical protein